ncbi:hypothetical protein FJY63_04470, partial [Candidatus Sumerlaeota bacterium]|nr:hypothetical protein [Candidatus Sumerlaeota bacterium]
ERKVCGILTERALSPRALVLGVGLNVHQTAKDFPPALRQSAGSLRMAGDRPWSRQALLVAFLRDFAKAYELWRSDRFGAILAECRRRMSTLGRHVLLHVGAPAADSTARLSSPKPELVAGPPVVSHERTRQSESFHAVARRVEGTVMGLDDDGSLVLRETTGIVSRWHSGDVEVVRWTETKNA